MANDQNKYAGISTLRTFLSQLKNLFITKTDADAALSGKADTTHKHDSDYDAKGSASTALDSAKAYADQNKVPTSRTVNGKALTSNITLSASDVGALPNTTSIPDALSDLSSDSTHRTVTDAEKATWNAKSNFSGSYNDLTNKPTIPSIAGLATETYADSAAVTAANKVKNDLLNGAGTAYDTLKELGDLIVDNADAIDALETIASGKADAEHSHAISDVSGLQSALDGKAASSHGTHVSFDSTNKPKMDGTAAFGSSSKVARADHVHPTDTTRAAQTDLDTHTGNTTIHITSTERTNWNAAKTHADSAHAPSNAEKNQNAFSNIKVGSTTIAADSTTDTLELVGSNVTITPDATNDKVTISVADASTGTKGVVQLTNSTSSTSTTTAATPNSVKSAYDLANTAKTNAATAQTRADNAYTLAESKVDSLSDLGITATATELNYVDGVTSSVQAQLDAIKNAKADWNQNDSTQLDYVKNRPFYTTDPVETVIVEGTIPANGMLQTSASINSLTLGETYNVVFDGTVYNNLVCENYDGLPSIGNDAFMFAIQSGRAMAYAANGSASHTIKVMALLSSIIPLERKYIAEHIDNLAGEKVTGKVYTVDGAQVTAGEGAEVFNDYSTNIASGRYSHAEGMNNIASGSTSHAEGYDVEASGSYSHAEGYSTTASASRSHAEGWSTEATAQGAHAEGFATHATGQNSHAEGDNATASGRASHAEGYGTDAIADYSHAEGMNTNASSEYQHVQGKYNIIDTEDTYAHIVGNGTGNSARKNAHTIDWKGNANFAGDVYVGNADTNKAGKKLATEEYVTNTVNAIDIPVDSVNGKTGAVTLSASDVGAAPKVAEKFTPAFSSQNAAPTDMLSIDLNGNFDASSNLWAGHVSTEDASTLRNFPITSGAFYGFRTVEKSPVGHFLVTVKEMYPVAGRIWSHMYDVHSGWKGWQVLDTKDKFLPLSGGTINGWLKFDGATIGNEWITADGTRFAIRPYHDGNLFQITATPSGGSEQASFNISRDGQVWLGKALPVDSGGTGATDVATALNNLGANPKIITHSFWADCGKAESGTFSCIGNHIVTNYGNGLFRVLFHGSVQTIVATDTYNYGIDTVVLRNLINNTFGTAFANLELKASAIDVWRYSDGLYANGGAGFGYCFQRLTAASGDYLEPARIYTREGAMGGWEISKIHEFFGDDAMVNYELWLQLS